MRVCVEFLGVSRLVTGLKETTLELREGASYKTLLQSLASTYPALVGEIIQPDLGNLYAPNRFLIQGTRFVKEDQMDDSLAEGDRVVLMSLSIGG